MNETKINFADYLETSRISNTESTAFDIMEQFWKPGDDNEHVSQVCQTLGSEHVSLLARVTRFFMKFHVNFAKND